MARKNGPRMEISLIGKIIIKNGRDRARVAPVGDVEIGKRGHGVGRLLERRAECAAVLESERRAGSNVVVMRINAPPCSSSS